MRGFTRDELSQFDGRDGVSYVACEGKMYDVSGSFIRKKGRHWVTHRAGQDLRRLSTMRRTVTSCCSVSPLLVS
jgi:predicted heme/steroid binding protein